MIQFDSKYKALVLEALEDMMYKLSIELSQLAGGPMDSHRKKLTKKQTQIETLQHIVSSSDD